MFQSYLYDKLKALWNLDDTSLMGYGRCYREKVDKGYRPRICNGKDYEDVFFDDQKHSALFFYDCWDSTKVDKGTPTARVDLIFVVNISKLKPNIPYRADEEVRNDVEQLSFACPGDFMVKEFGTGYKYVFNRFDGLTSKDEEQLRDVHPIHVFKITFDLIYNIYN